MSDHVNVPSIGALRAESRNVDLNGKYPILGVIAVVLSIVPFAARADAEFETGQFIKLTERWGDKMNRFLDGADEGEGQGCWQITKVTRSSIHTVLVSGRVKPWWSDEVLPLGMADEHFDSDNFREANPDAPALTMTKRIFTVVSSC